MSGLLADLEALAQAADLDGIVQGQAGNLEGIAQTVTQLLDGPPELGDLVGVIGNPPLPPGLGGLSAAVPALTGIVDGAPGDTLGPLAPMLAPLTELAEGDGLAAGVNATITASLEGLRALLEVAGGRLFGGASGMPLAALLWGRQGMPAPLPDLGTVRARIGEVTGLLDQAIGDLDAAAVLALLRRAAGAWSRPLRKWPSLPVITEMMEALDTVGSWQDMDSAAITASLRHTLEQVAVLVATPRERVARPYLDAAAQAGAAPETLAAARQALQPLMARLRDKVLVTGVEPSSDELRALDAQVVALETLAAALAPQSSPLADVDALPAALEKQMLRVVRALMPAYDMAPLAGKLRARFEALPPAPEAPLAELVQAVNDADISAITDPLQAIGQAVESAVQAVNDARDSVRDALTDLLSPIDQALSDAMAAIGLQDIIAALQGLPAELQTFIDDQVMPQVAGVKGAIEGAVDTVSDAADAFDPDALLAPIRDALQSAADRLSDSEVTAVFQELEETLSQAIAALEDFDLAPAADESISLLEEVEAKLAAIDPAAIPDAAKPLLRQAVQVVTRVDFAGDVATPLIRDAEDALAAGPVALLDALEGGVAQVRQRIEAFRPSQVVGEALDEPFQSLLATLRAFQPSALLEQLAQALDQVAEQVSIADVGAVLGPIEELHERLVEEMERLRPSTLLRPVEDAIEAAVAKVFEVARIDDIFDGIDDVLGTVRDGVALLDDARAGLEHMAGLLADLGSGDAALDALVSAAAAKLDDVALAELGPAFEDVAAAVALVQRDALAGEIAGGFQRAADRVPEALASGDAAHLRAMAAAFPRAALEALAPAPSRRRLAALIARLDRATAELEAARAPWSGLAGQLALHAGRIQEDLLRYHRVTLIEGGTVFDDLAVAPASTAALRDAVAGALEDGLREPVSMVMLAVQALAPYVEELARDLAAFIAAVHTRLDAIAGEDGLSGVVGSVEEVADLLRDIDLTPVTDPLDAIWARIQGAVQGLDPTPLRQALEAARDALAGLLQLSTLLDQEEIDQIDHTYRTVLEKLELLSPGRVISETLDPLYEELLATIAPVLDMPGRLRELVDTAGRSLGDEILEELARVEQAFDRMLGALPLEGGGAGGRLEGGGSVGTNLSVG